MIKNTEIRIGNWINGNYGGFSKDVVVYDMNRVSIQHTDEWVNDLPYKYFNPIPLNEEWLFKFGFYKEKDMFYFKYGVITYALCADNHGFVFGICNNPNIDWFSWEIKYVNQLQNLYFAITGSELVLSNAPEATKPAL